MADATVIPTWLAIVVTVGTPLLTFAGVWAANRVSSRGNEESETRSRREETMRNLRWAAELALDDDPKRALLGLKELQALETADMLDEEQKVFVTAALNAVIAEPESAIHELAEEGQEVIIEVEAPDPGRTHRVGKARGGPPGVDFTEKDGGSDG